MQHSILFFQPIDLIAALGGQAGLWVGVSVIAFFELIELVYDLIWLSIKFTRKRIRDGNEVSNLEKASPDDLHHETSVMADFDHVKKPMKNNIMVADM